MKRIGVTFDETLLERLDQQPEVREQGRSAVLRRAVADYLASKELEATPRKRVRDASRPESAVVHKETVARPTRGTPHENLSLSFFSRLLRFVEWEPGWDGEAAEHIDHATAQKALEIALSMRAIASEPFVAPAPSGSLLLQWDFRDGTYVDVFVDSDSEFPAEAALVLKGVVHEIELTEPATLRTLLRKRAAPETAAR